MPVLNMSYFNEPEKLMRPYADCKDDWLREKEV